MKSTAPVVRSSLFSLALGLTALFANAQTPPATPPAASPAPAVAPKTSTTAPAAKPPVAAPAPALDLGDSSSSTLTTKAWGALLAKNYPAVLGYTNKCIELYKDQALKMQAGLKEKAPKESANQYWALNDVGTCYFIQGKALDDQGDKKGAIAAYKTLADTLSFAQCWDTKGWFWSPADGARKRLAELQFDAAQ